jgi:hypothetical protein
MASDAARKSPLKASNYSPVGWYVATILERFEFGASGPPEPDDRVLVWANTVLINASSPQEAYAKAVKLGRLSNQKYRNLNGEQVRVSFEGLSSLIPVYDELADGSELFWRRSSVKLKTLRSWVKKKNELESFEREGDA